MPDESTDVLLEEIRDAHSKKLDWTTLAEALSALKKSKKMKEEYPTRALFWEALEPLTGYTRNMLQRIESTLFRIQEIERGHRSEIQEALGLKKWEDGALVRMFGQFTKAELFARIYKLDQEAAMDELHHIRDEGVRIGQLRDVLKGLANSRPDGQVFTLPGKGPRQQLAFLDQHLDEIYGGKDVRIYFGYYKFSSVCVDAVAIYSFANGGIEFIDAFQHVPNLVKEAHDGFKALLMATDFRSSFFRHQWLVLTGPLDFNSDALPGPLQGLKKAIDELGIPRIGILALDPEGTPHIVRRPENDEKPDRHQSVLNEVVQQGIPDFGAE